MVMKDLGDGGEGDNGDGDDEDAKISGRWWW